jgi:Protein of unknown function (DUF3263)
MALSDGDRALLQFEATWWKRPGSKQAAIRLQFGISPSAYYRRLNALVDSAEALEHAPMVVRRLRKRRSLQRRQRFEGDAAPGHPAR